jgi:hypothetical protein
MIQLDNEKELDQAIAQGHCMILFASSTCRGCDIFRPQWEAQIEKFDFLNPKWRFYIMEEKNATRLLNHLQVERIPALVVFDCPENHHQTQYPSTTVTCGEHKSLHRYAYQIPTQKLDLVKSIRPWLRRECGCAAPIRVGRLYMKSSRTTKQQQVLQKQGVQTKESKMDASSTNNPNPNNFTDLKSLIRNESRIFDSLLSDTLFSFVHESLSFADDPVTFVKLRNGS